MSLLARISPMGAEPSEPEDLLGSALGVIFPDDVAVQHGDATTALLYTSPHLPKPLQIELADPEKDSERRLFSHYLWNSSLLLAEFVEAGTIKLDHIDENGDISRNRNGSGEKLSLPKEAFNIRGKKTIELGAGTALPSMMAALLGADEVMITDYPSDLLLTTLKKNITTNLTPHHSPLSTYASSPPTVSVQGHAWGVLSAPPAATRAHAFDVVFAADCLWMPWQHDNLRRSIVHFMKDVDARAWVVAGFHTGREKMAGFFDGEALCGVGLEVEGIWERDCDGVEARWGEGAVGSDVSGRKRWCVVAVLRRCRGR